MLKSQWWAVWGMLGCYWSVNSPSSKPGCSLAHVWKEYSCAGQVLGLELARWTPLNLKDFARKVIVSFSNIFAKRFEQQTNPVQRTFYPLKTTENRNHWRQSWEPSENINTAAEQAISDDLDIWNSWPSKLTVLSVWMHTDAKLENTLQNVN